MDETHRTLRVAPAAAQFSEVNRVSSAIEALGDGSKLALVATAREEQQEPLPADALEVQLRPSTLQDLPHDLLLARLLHLPGLQFPRRVCKAWRAAYGPLTGGLRLTPADLSTRIPPMLATDPHRYAHITSLHLCRPHAPPQQHPRSGAGSSRSPPPPSPPLPTAEAFSTLLQALPSLLSLSDLHSIAITDPSSAEPQALRALPSLAPQLTALCLATPGGRLPLRSAALRLTLQALPCLRALTLHCPLADLARSTCYQLQVLSMLTALESLDLHHDDVRYRLPRTSWLTALGALGRLTALKVGPGLTISGEACVATLGTGLARLQALTLPVCEYAPAGQGPGLGEAVQRPVVLALGQLTGLTALDLCVNGLTGQFQDMGALGSLPQLRRLGLAASCGCETPVEACLAGLSRHRVLTHLRIHCYNWLDYVAPAVKAVGLTNVSLFHLGALHGCLQELELGAACCDDPVPMLSILACLTRLQVLRLQRVQLGGAWPADTVLLLSALQDLRVLEVGSWCSELSGGLLQLLGCFTGLRTLALGDPPADPPAGPARLLRAGISDAALRMLLFVQHTLADLELFSCRAVGGPGLAVVLPVLTRLTSLTLRDMAMVTSPRLSQFLLPLPCSLRHLHLHLASGARLAAGERERVQGGVDAQVNCTLHVWEDP